MKLTIFNTPIISPLLRLLSRLIMRLVGWRVDGKMPNLSKYVIIAAPHTSNWDFLLFLGIVFHLGISVRYMGKAELFNNPFGWFFYWCGGVPVDRKKSVGLVDQMVEVCNQSDKFILVIAPEGTRYQVNEWKRGFYHIAKSANIPIVTARVDGIQKIAHVGQIFQPGDDIEADMKAIQESFIGMTGINPRLKTKKKYITLAN
ncbi:MAG TPA: lysophospholipid acyltransferase family protein [Anaerolineales bacterium]|nr:lysophospholipid acyltransferase family protein [Anaerolineales bacterium]HND47005.1 lysophospholipid acyltransferase family protein [Anaerolineales bacterium]HNF94804.1 lysophospholipid acyltransferase family protein [Anaerolineales bacterium]